MRLKFYIWALKRHLAFMNDSNLLKYYLYIIQIPGVGHVNAKNLISYCGGVENVFSSSKKQLLKVPGIGEKSASAILNLDSDIVEKTKREIEFIEKNDIQALNLFDKSYPQRLKQCADAPVLLFYKGNADLNQQRIISVVGTRNASQYGKDICRKMAEQLKPYNILIASGLAYGIDYNSHKAAIKNNIHTVGVLAHGLDRIYPSPHHNIAKQMVECGGLLTEFMSETIPDRENFPQRNRIIAGMADATIVVETAHKGGSIITAYYADAYNRDVFAFPGRIDDKYSVGCNHLIKKNIAALLEKPEDIATFLQWNKTEQNPKSVQRNLFIELTESEQKILTLLREQNNQHIDNIVQYMQQPFSGVATTLLELELKGVIRSVPGNIYRIV